MKGHLDAKDLETYRKEDLQELARELGVSDEGTKAEIAARCAEVEVDIPDDDQQQGQKPDDDQQQGQKPDDDQQQKTSDKVKVECIQNYKDLVLNRVVKTGEQYEVTPERAALLLEEKLVKKI